MKTFKLETQTDANGNLLLDLKTDFKSKKMEVLIVVQETDKTSKYNFTNLIGKLEWDGDPLAEQKKIRAEWD